MLYIDYNEMYKQLSSKYSLPKYQIEFIHKAIFEMVADKIREEKKQNIYLAKFGRFIVPDYKYEKYLEKIRGDSERMDESIDSK